MNIWITWFRSGGVGGRLYLRLLEFQSMAGYDDDYDENTRDYVDEDVEDLSSYDYPTHEETESDRLVRDIKERDEEDVESDPELFDSNRERANRERHRATIINFKEFGKVCPICGDYIDGETCNNFSKHSAIKRMKERFDSD